MDADEEGNGAQHSTLSTQPYFRRAMRLCCPLCGADGLFTGLTMRETCPACGFSFEREPGYWTNAATLNFMITGGVAVMLVAPLAYSGLPVLLVIGFGLTLGALLPLLAFRHFKALWLALDLRIRPPTTFERLSAFLHMARESIQ